MKPLRGIENTKIYSITQSMKMGQNEWVRMNNVKKLGLNIYKRKSKYLFHKNEYTLFILCFCFFSLK